MEKKKPTPAVAQETVAAMEQSFENEVKVASTPKDSKPDVNKKWEIKDRDYYLVGKAKPLTYSIKSSNIYYFDEELGYERELKNTSNQRTCFVDEMKGDQRLEHIVFRNGVLRVPRNKVALQKLLSLYHPWKGNVYDEYNPVSVAVDQVASIELEIEALNTAQQLDIDLAEAVLRVEIVYRVSEMSSKELKRDLLLYAKRNPGLFLELVNDDNVQLRNVGIRATERGLIKLSSDQRTFKLSLIHI